MRKITARLSLLAGLALTATSLSAVQAGAAPPTVLTNEWREVTCTAVTDGLEITVRASTSDQGGPEVTAQSSAQLSYDTGETIGGGASDSTWTDTTFSAIIPIYAQSDGDGSGGHRYFYDTGVEDVPVDEGPPIGEVSFSGSFTTGGDPMSDPVKGQDGNIHFDQNNTVTPLEVALGSLTYQPTGSGGSTEFTDVSCEGMSGSGSLTYTNPHTVVRHEDDTVAQCQTNADEYEVWQEEDGWYVWVGYLDILPDGDDDPENNVQLRTTAAGLIDFGRDGTWEGELEVVKDLGPGQGEEWTSASATGTFEREGQPFHVTQEDRQGLRDHAQFTPHRLTLVVDLADPYLGPGEVEGADSIELDCVVSTVKVTERTVNQPEE